MLFHKEPGQKIGFDTCGGVFPEETSIKDWNYSMFPCSRLDFISGPSFQKHITKFVVYVKFQCVGSWEEFGLLLFAFVLGNMFFGSKGHDCILTV